MNSYHYNYITHPTMPIGRPVVDLEPLKEQILSLFHLGYTHQEIALEVHAKERTISRRLQAWGI